MVGVKADFPPFGFTAITKFSDLNGRRVATVQGSTGDRVVALLAPQAQRTTFGQNSEALLALKGGRRSPEGEDDLFGAINVALARIRAQGLHRRLTAKWCGALPGHPAAHADLLLRAPGPRHVVERTLASFEIWLTVAGLYFITQRLERRLVAESA